MIPFASARGFLAQPSSTFAPTDIAGLAIWLKTDAGLYQDTAGVTPATTNGDPIGLWQDQSGNARHATQATGTKKPILTTSGLNGRSVITFDGADDFMNSSTFTALGVRTIYAVVRHTNSPVTNAYFFDSFSSAAGDRSAAGTATNTTWNMFAGNNYATGTFNSSVHIHVCIFNTTASQRITDGVAAATGNAGTSSPADYVIGSGRQGTSFFMQGYIAELLVYTGVHNSTQLGQMAGYLNGRFAVY